MRHQGFSLLQLLFTLLVLAVLLSVAVPGLSWLVLDARRTADINALVTSIQFARSESAKRGVPVVLCKTVDLTACGGSGVFYESGWMVFVDTDNDSPPRRDADEPLLYRYQPVTEGGSIRSNRASYTFRPYYRRSTNGTVTFCDRRGDAAARAVIISYTGRPRVSDRCPGDRRLVCAS